MALRILVLALAAPCASSLVAPRAHARAATRVHFLSPEMSGAIDKLVNKDKYESIVKETMVKEDCDRAEAERRYNQFLFDPDGYSMMKMNEQLADEGYSSFEEKFIAEKGQDAWDARQVEVADQKEARGKNGVLVVGVLFTAFAVSQAAGLI